MPYRIFCWLVLTLLSATATLAQSPPDLVVAWVADGDLWLWRSAASTAIQYTPANALHPYLSPDGQYVAYTTSAPSSLWLIAPNSPVPIEIVPNTALAKDDPQFIHINNVQWGSGSTLYFSTYFGSQTASARLLDFWSVDVVQRTYKQLFPIGEGGVFTLSPNRDYIAFVQPGRYESTPATLRIMDTAHWKPLNTFTYPAVSSASSDDFIPPLSWQRDSLSLKVGIPDKNLIYADDTALTALWQLGVDGSQAQIGTVQASFFSLPQWSTDGTDLTYMRHKGAITDNVFELMLASGDGSNPVVYLTGQAGSLGTPQWLPDSRQFIFPRYDAGEYWLGQPSNAPTRLLESSLNLRFVNRTLYVYNSGFTNNTLLAYADLAGMSPVPIAHVEFFSFFNFDAVIIP